MFFFFREQLWTCFDKGLSVTKLLFSGKFVLRRFFFVNHFRFYGLSASQNEVCFSHLWGIMAKNNLNKQVREKIEQDLLKISKTLFSNTSSEP